MKFSTLGQLYRNGQLTLDQLRAESVDPEDFRKLRHDHNEGKLHVDLVDDALVAAFAERDEDEKARGYTFIMSSGTPVGYFRDLPLPDSWNLQRFKRLGGPLLWAHNMRQELPPIGRMQNVQKGVLYKGMTCLMGDAVFKPDGMDTFADFIHAQVAAGWLRGGSVGFNIIEARKPTEDEVKQHKLHEYSTVFSKCELFEYSIVPIGRDVHAMRVQSESGEIPLDEHFQRCIADGWSRDVVGTVREALLSECGQSGRFLIEVPRLGEPAAPVARPQPEPAPRQQAQPTQLSESTVRELVERATDERVARLAARVERLESELAAAFGLAFDEEPAAPAQPAPEQHTEQPAEDADPLSNFFGELFNDEPAASTTEHATA